MRGQPEICLQGAPVSGGVAIGKPYMLHISESIVPEITVPCYQIEREVKRYQKALEASRQDIIRIRDRLASEGVTEAVSVLDAHLEIMSDPLLNSQVEQQIRQVSKNAEHVFHIVVRHFRDKFQAITDPFFRERFKDIQDISRRILGHLQNSAKTASFQVPENSIIFALDISPTEAAEATPSRISAFVTRGGASTSHAAIVAKAKGIPYVAHVDFPEFNAQDYSLAIVDGINGMVFLNPTHETLLLYERIQQKLHSRSQQLETSCHLPSKTRDGFDVRISANMENIEELEALDRFGASGIGLFRTEFFALTSMAFPSEEEQFHLYRHLIDRVQPNPIVIRVFDVGSDKIFFDSRENHHEVNPALGCRAIRYLLRNKDIFKSQLRAILRAAAFGDLRILLPMVSNVTELRTVKSLIEDVKRELSQENIEHAKVIKCGCMIEVPSAAINSDLLAQECDFFSIGTNDLVQYTLAIDRTNHSLSHFYDALDPAILRLLNIIVKSANEQEIPVSLCGEIATDPRSIPLLLGLGITELSVSVRFLPVVKNAVRAICMDEAREIARQALKMQTAQDVRALLGQRVPPSQLLSSVEA